MLFQHGPIGALVLLFDDENHLLLLKPSYRRDNLWSLPGGFSRRSESPTETVVREAREELGIEVTVTALLAEGRGEFGEVSFACAGERMDPTASIVLSAEHSEWRWFALHALPPLGSRIADLLSRSLDRMAALQAGAQRRA